MRFSDIIVEKIVNFPHKLGAYVDFRIRELSKINSDIVASCAGIVASMKDFSDNDGDYVVRYIFGRHDVRYFDDLKQAAEPGWDGEEARLVRDLNANVLLENLKAYKAHGPTFLRYVMSAIENSKPVPDYLQQILDVLPFFEEGAEAEGYTDSGDDAGYLAVKQTVDYARQLADALKRFEAFKTGLHAKLTAWEQATAYSASGKAYRPEHGSTETLYHASAFAGDIVRNGFAAERPMNRQGLGSLGTQSLISFTHSLEIAHTIAKCLKEVWMIAHGQLTARTLVGWIRKEGLDREYTDIATTIGLSMNDGEPGPFGQRKRVKTLDEIARENSPQDAVQVYRVYLWLNKIRSNPVFTGIEDMLELMKGVALADIGVVACECAIDPKDEYMIGEREFRLPASSVQSVKRLF